MSYVKKKGSRKKEMKDRERSWTRCCCCCWGESLLSSHTDEFRSFSSDFPAGLMTTTSCRVSHKKLSSRKFPSFPERKNKATTKTTITITTTTRYYHSIPAHNIDPIHRHNRPNELLTIVWIQKKPTQQTNKQTNNQSNKQTNIQSNKRSADFGKNQPSRLSETS
jgi:hypothetical protein